MIKAIQLSGHIVRFIATQTFKLLTQPERLVVIPWTLMRPIFLRIFGPLILSVYRKLPHRWVPEALLSESARYHFAKGSRLLDDNRPGEAWRCFQKCLETTADPHHFFLSAACLIVGLGRYRDAIALLTRANALRLKKAKELGVDNSNIRYLAPIWNGAFGHLAQLQYLVKLNILEGRRREDTIVYLSPECPPVNRFLFEQWRPYLNVIENKAHLPISLDALHWLSFDFYGPRMADGSTAYYWEAAAGANQRWVAENRGAVLTFPPEYERRGDDALARVGIKPGTWFVALHVREGGSKKHHADLHNVLNCNIEDYFSTITEITNRGGWVIRMGDPSMKPLPPLPNTFDYCHSTLRSDWMDIFLLAKCRFFLGTSSGPTYVPAAYGVPSVLTNWWPYAQRPWDEKAIFLPKLYRRLQSGRALPLSQALAEPFGYCNSIDYLTKREGVIVEDNTPDDIRDAVVEMMDRLDGTARYEPTDIALRERAEKIFEVGGAHGVGMLARDYLRRNKALVD